MSDRYPENFTLEIDRVRLRRYLRTKWLLSWTLFLGFFGGLMGFGAMGKVFEGKFTTGTLLLIAKGIGIGLGVSSLLALACYFLMSHWVAGRLAASLEVSVEGPFLQIRQRTHALSDRKLHFRSIVDYATTQDALMAWFGISALQMTTTGGSPASILIIAGVKDCLKMRDTLSEIDRLREVL